MEKVAATRVGGAGSLQGALPGEVPSLPCRFWASALLLAPSPQARGPGFRARLLVVDGSSPKTRKQDNSVQHGSLN